MDIRDEVHEVVHDIILDGTMGTDAVDESYGSASTDTQSGVRLLDAEKVLASVDSIGTDVERISAEEGLVVDTKTTNEWDNKRFNKDNENRRACDDEPLKNYKLVMSRSPSTASGFVSCDKRPLHPTCRIVPRGTVSVSMGRILVMTHKLTKSASEEPELQRIHLAQALRRNFGAQDVRDDALVRVEAALVPNKGMKNRCMEFSKKTLTGDYRVLFAHSQGIESLGRVNADTGGTLKIGLTDRMSEEGAKQLSLSTKNDNPLKIWGECNICGASNTIGPQTLPYELMERGGTIDDFTCRHYCTGPMGEEARLNLRRKGVRTLETIMTIWVPVKTGTEPPPPGAPSLADPPDLRKPPTSLEQGAELANGNPERDLSAMHVDPSRRVLVNATVLFGVTDAIRSKHDVPMPLHPSDGDIRGAVCVIKSMYEGLPAGTMDLCPGPLQAKNVLKLHDLEDEEDDQADRPFGKRRKLE